MRPSPPFPRSILRWTAESSASSRRGTGSETKSCALHSSPSARTLSSSTDRILVHNRPMRRLSARMACQLALLSALAAPAAAQTVLWHQFDPLVVPSTQTQSVLLEASLSAGASRVSLDLDAGGTLEMKDDGTGGDRRA